MNDIHAALADGDACYRRQDLEGAAAAYRAVVDRHPELARAHYNLGIVLRDLDRVDAARNCFETVVRLRPRNAHAWNNLGLLHSRDGRLDDALHHYRRALEIDPDFADAHFNLGMLHLHLGNYREGWAECEWRWRTRQFLPINSPQPLWDGQPMRGTLLVHTEQGAGDAIQFARFLPEAARRCDRLMLVAPEHLHALFRPMGCFAEIRGAGVFPAHSFQAYIPLMSLPHRFGVSLDSLPGAIPYLRAPSGPVPLPGVTPGDRTLNVGIVWAGNPNQANNIHRSCCLRDLAPILETSGARFFSLQKGPAEDELQEFPGAMTRLGPQLTDYAATAAFMESMDLVISVCTSVAHLAGSLGKPVWILLSRRADWRWLTPDRLDSPWYPTARLFRQQTLDQWAGVAQDVARALEALRK